MAQQDKAFSREDLIKALNDDLSREYQAVIAYVVYSQSLKGAQAASRLRACFVLTLLRVSSRRSSSHCCFRSSKRLTKLRGTPHRPCPFDVKRRRSKARRSPR